MQDIWNFSNYTLLVKFLFIYALIINIFGRIDFGQTLLQIWKRSEFLLPKCKKGLKSF